MECGFCLSGTDGDEYEDYTCAIETANCSITCDECGEEIPTGAKYELSTGVYWDERHTHETCLVCAEIAEALSCDGRVHGQLWDDIESLIEEGATVGIACLNKLRTSAAKAELQRFWISCMGFDR